MRGGGFGGIGSMPSMSSGLRGNPSMGGLGSSSNFGTLRMPSGMGRSPGLGNSGLGNLGVGASGLGGGTLRVSPNTGAMRSPNLNPGSSIIRSGNGSLSRATMGNVRPNIGSTGPRTTLPGGNQSLGNRSTLGGIGQSGLRLNQGNVARTTLRPSGSSALNGNFTSAAANRGRATPQSLNNFLSIPGRNGGIGHNGGIGNGSGGFNGTHNGGRGVPVSHLGNRTNINNSFNRLNVTQINNINNGIRNGFHNHRGYGFNNGFGYSSFGFGFGSPYWNNWGLGVRGYWNPYGYNGLFGNRFWATNYSYYPWRRSYYYWGGYPYSYWWNTPTWGGLNSWFPTYGWSTPYYYGYGPGGNVVYSSGTVYMNDVPIASAADYAASAAELAIVPTPTNPDATVEWMPLGTFALSESETDKDPSRVVQLAVDKDGIISGTMFNKSTNQTYPIQGRVDKETQRVAFTIGDAKDVVFETGIYNLTQQQTPVLVHGEGREETYLLLRLEQPKDGSEAATPGVGATTPAPPAPGFNPEAPALVPPGPTPVR